VLTYGTVFSGIEGFGCGFDAAGMRGLFHVEIDPHCRAVLRRHYPDSLILEDVHDCGAHNLPAVDVFAFGSPCQDLSVAGRRAGLDGERSGLFVEGVRIADQLAPRWIVFENVPGLLSSQRGEDFAVVLEGFTGWRPAVPEGGWRNGGCIAGPLRWACWSVLDSQFRGVAQRRRRVFVVAGAGVECRPSLLLECPCVSGDSPPSREAGARVAVSALGCAGGASRGHRLGADEVAGGQVVAALRASDGGPDDNRAQAGHVVAATLTANYGKQLDNSDRNGGPPNLVFVAQCHGSNVGPMGTLKGDGVGSGVPFVAHTLRGEGFDASEDGSGRGTPLVAQTAPCVRGREQRGPDSDCTSGLIVEPMAFQPKASASQSMNPGEQCPALGTTKTPAVAFSVNQRREGRLRGVHASLNGEPSGTQVDGVLAPIPLTYVHPRILRNSLSSNQVGIKDDGLSDALTSEGPGAVMTAIPRRLTPVECARLQAFPDDWNEWGLTAGGERIELSDSARYRQMGNAVTASVSRWIGERLLSAVEGEGEARNG
jgi:DNA (cytosine-5)-methyltransferase 1